MASNVTVGTCLWFEKDSEAAANFYVSLLPDSRIVQTLRWREGWENPGGAAEPGRALSIEFELAGHRIMLLEGGTAMKLTDAASITVACETQEEIDRLWTALTADGGTEIQCGWLRDRFGVAWQIFPERLTGMMADPDLAKATRTFKAMIGMVKLDIAALEKAYAGA